MTSTYDLKALSQWDDSAALCADSQPYNDKVIHKYFVLDNHISYKYQLLLHTYTHTHTHKSTCVHLHNYSVCNQHIGAVYTKELSSSCRSSC